MSDTPLLDITNLSCAYGEHPILKGVSLSLQEGEILSILGPSGCGKTTALRTIAGFIKVQNGEISLSGELISCTGWSMAPEKRGIGMVFQDYALFPHLSIEENIAFGLCHLSAAQRTETVDQMLELIGMSQLKGRYPHELSGGQQQRIALARALAPRPRLLLMDEPFSNLDTDMRKQLSGEMRQILKHQGIAAIVVTHDQQEAFTLSDKVAVLISGEVKQCGTPQELFYTPASPDVASFVSNGMLFKGVATGDSCFETELGLVESAEPLGFTDGQAVEIFLRPTDLELTPDRHSSAQIEQIEFQGTHSLYSLRLHSGKQVQVLRIGQDHFEAGDQVGLRISAHHPIVFPALS